MKTAAILLWLLAAPKALLTDEVYQIPAGESRYIELVVPKQTPVAVDCSFEVTSGGPGVRLELVSKQDFEQLLASKAYEPLAATGVGSSGSLQLPVRIPGQYVVVIWTARDARNTASVHIRLSLDFSGSVQAVASYLTPQRRWTVIVISFAAFFTIVIVSGRKLLQAMKVSRV